MAARAFDARVCALGEGPLWHPERKQLFWFDILGKRLLTRDADGPKEWEFDELVSAAGWVSRDELLIASETKLFLFDLAAGRSTPVAPLEAENAITRSNDGRADPYGGFWIGTMGKNAESGAGAIYRWRRGELRTLHQDITISNAICFSPDGRFAYFTDTPTAQILRQELDDAGWPAGPAEIFLDLNDEGLHPDGAVIDAEGCLWNAQWGASRVARYAPDGRLLSAVTFPAAQISCPALGGDDMKTLYATSAAGGAESDDAEAGRTFSAPVDVLGQPEHRIHL